MFDPRHRTRGVVSAATTLWYISTPDVAAVLHDEPRADRGFGRKFLAQLRPDWPVTPIGQFPLNRSTDASRGEFYIAAYPGVAVVHTLLDAIERPSRLSPDLLTALPADDIYAISTHPDGSGPSPTGLADASNAALPPTATPSMKTSACPSPSRDPSGQAKTTNPSAASTSPSSPPTSPARPKPRGSASRSPPPAPISTWPPLPSTAAPNPKSTNRAPQAG